jgi:hypothetical protein
VNQLNVQLWNLGLSAQFAGMVSLIVTVRSTVRLLPGSGIV